MSTKVAVLDSTSNQLILVDVPPTMLISAYLFSEEHLNLNPSCVDWMVYTSVKEIKL